MPPTLRSRCDNALTRTNVPKAMPIPGRRNAAPGRELSPDGRSSLRASTASLWARISRHQIASSRAAKARSASLGQPSRDASQECLLEGASYHRHLTLAGLVGQPTEIVASPTGRILDSSGARPCDELVDRLEVLLERVEGYAVSPSNVNPSSVNRCMHASTAPASKRVPRPARISARAASIPSAGR